MARWRRRGASADLIECPSHESSPAQSTPRGEMVGCAPAKQATSYGERISWPISGVGGEDLPDDDQQLAGNGHNGFGRRHPGGEVLVARPPPGRSADRRPDGIADHDASLWVSHTPPRP